MDRVTLPKPSAKPRAGVPDPPEPLRTAVTACHPNPALVGATGPPRGSCPLHGHVDAPAGRPLAARVRAHARDGPRRRRARPPGRRPRVAPARARPEPAAGDALPPCRRRRDHRRLPAARVRRAARAAGRSRSWSSPASGTSPPPGSTTRRRSRSASPSSASNATCSGPRPSAGTSTPTGRPAISPRPPTSTRSSTGSPSGGPAR